ncbi:FCD domain-containing protein [Azospirillum halopraeferens]|uniref:FCD domain-containing protein n=1 Tax=Azospirillum halopraeferens TaxID=34010 RepID=UPI00042736BD|nr:FCD domain-containing protein [Azospirillum halopraeferens]
MREPVKPKAADVIAGHLETLILEGVLRPGERLLGERDLAERLDVSRPTLRDAVQKLEAKGLLSAGREGTFVTDPVGAALLDPLAALLESHPQTTFDYLEFRRTVEGHAARLAALRATEIDRDALRAVFARMEASHRLDDPGDEADADCDLHLAIYEAAHNVVLLHVMRGLSTLLRRGVFYSRTRLYTRPGTRELLLAQHRAIYEAVMDRDADAAAEAAERHIAYTLDTVREIRDEEARVEASLRRIGRGDLVATAPRAGQQEAAPRAGN